MSSENLTDKHTFSSDYPLGSPSDDGRTNSDARAKLWPRTPRKILLHAAQSPCPIMISSAPDLNAAPPGTPISVGREDAQIAITPVHLQCDHDVVGWKRSGDFQGCGDICAG